jgi:hypothetical protein
MSGNIEKLFGGAFDPSGVPQSDYSPIPEGDYVAQIESEEFKPTAKGGTQLVLKFQIIGSAQDGKTITERLNLQNDNEKAVEIGLQTLAKITTAAGLSVLKDTSELVGKKMYIGVAIKKGEGTYIDRDGNERKNNDQNVIKKYAQMTGASSTPTRIASEPVADNGVKKMPWAK